MRHEPHRLLRARKHVVVNAALATVRRGKECRGVARRQFVIGQQFNTKQTNALTFRSCTQSCLKARPSAAAACRRAARAGAAAAPPGYLPPADGGPAGRPLTGGCLRPGCAVDRRPQPKMRADGQAVQRAPRLSRRHAATVPSVSACPSPQSPAAQGARWGDTGLLQMRNNASLVEVGTQHAPQPEAAALSAPSCPLQARMMAIMIPT